MSRLLFTDPSWLATHSQARRVIRHVLVWLLILPLAVAAVRAFVLDTLVVNAGFMVLLTVPPMAYFYLLGYVVFPRFLYRFRPLPLLVYVMGLYWISYLLNKVVLTGLLAYTNSSASYTSYINTILDRAGWVGCFTNLRVALWHYAVCWLLITILLLIKVLRDITSYRNRKARLQADKLRLERDQLALERSQLALELDMFKAQVSPHFLFNTLNSVYARVIDTDPQTAAQVIRLAELMRYNLHEASTERIALSRELDHIHDYLQLEQARHAEWVDVTLTTGDYRPDDYQIAPLLLIPFVENAFKHGVRAGQPSAIRVAALIEAGDMLLFTVANDLRSGVATAPGRKSGGVGLVNVRKRLDLMYANRYTLETGPLADEYVVSLRLQIDRSPTAQHAFV